MFKDEAAYLFVSTIVLLTTTISFGVYIFLNENVPLNENMEDCLDRGGYYSTSVGKGNLSDYEFCMIEEKIRY